MIKDILQQHKNEIIRRTGKKELEVLEPLRKPTSLLNFRYSYKEVSSYNGKTHIKSKEKRFENGKLESEEFEGTLDHDVYFNMVGGMQKHFLNQMMALMKNFSMLLPFGSKYKGK